MSCVEGEGLPCRGCSPKDATQVQYAKDLRLQSRPYQLAVMRITYCKTLYFREHFILRDSLF